jgi:hypothetical protein
MNNLMINQLTYCQYYLSKNNKYSGSQLTEVHLTSALCLKTIHSVPD